MVRCSAVLMCPYRVKGKQINSAPKILLMPFLLQPSQLTPAWAPEYRPTGYISQWLGYYDVAGHV